jgi:hypothetical protein
MQNFWVLTPLFGAFLFVFLYFVATLFYPGGSQADKKSIGFSRTDNYWCNLLNENAMNGEHNSAKPLALISMFILCLTLATFGISFHNKLILEKITAWPFRSPELFLWQ